MQMVIQKLVSAKAAARIANGSRVRVPCKVVCCPLPGPPNEIRRCGEARGDRTGASDRSHRFVRTRTSWIRKRHRWEPGHTRDTRAHTDTRITQTNPPDLQPTKHQHTRSRTTSRDNRIPIAESAAGSPVPLSVDRTKHDEDVPHKTTAAYTCNINATYGFKQTPLKSHSPKVSEIIRTSLKSLISPEIAIISERSIGRCNPMFGHCRAPSSAKMSKPPPRRTPR